MMWAVGQIMAALKAAGVDGIFAAVAAGMLAYGVLSALAVWLSGWRN